MCFHGEISKISFFFFLVERKHLQRTSISWLLRLAQLIGTINQVVD